MSKTLSEILDSVMWEDVRGGIARLHTIDELEQAVKAWVAEEVIGQDETSDDEVENLFYATRNGLRLQQRKRLQLDNLESE